MCSDSQPDAVTEHAQHIFDAAAAVTSVTAKLLQTTLLSRRRSLHTFRRGGCPRASVSHYVRCCLCFIRLDKFIHRRMVVPNDAGEGIIPAFADIVRSLGVGNCCVVCTCHTSGGKSGRLPRNLATFWSSCGRRTERATPSSDTYVASKYAISSFSPSTWGLTYCRYNSPSRTSATAKTG